ncbi:hypothetical protein B0H19DRAFT_1168780 [Mycena capillaripes]|nr:hypothetical protein B0H19DRAFT_1168780 [Mycena capillaripes]
MSKRKFDEQSDMDTLTSQGGLSPKVINALKFHPDSVSLIAQLVNRLDISEHQLKRARMELPSFSHVTWAEVADFFNLCRGFHALKLAPIPNLTPCFLPPSFHWRLYLAAWHAMDVYSEPMKQKLEAPRFRFFDSYLIPLFASFPALLEISQSDPYRRPNYRRRVAHWWSIKSLLLETSSSWSTKRCCARRKKLRTTFLRALLHPYRPHN